MYYRLIRIFIFLLICINITCFFSSPASAQNESAGRGKYRPDNIDRGQRRVPSMNYVDAYGNSIFEEFEKKPREKRISAGAYGGYGAPKEKESRPLPDVPSEPIWSFE